MNRREVFFGQDGHNEEPTPSITSDRGGQEKRITRANGTIGSNRREFLAALPFMVAPLTAIGNLVHPREESSSRIVKPARFEVSKRRPDGISPQAIEFVETAIAEFNSQDDSYVHKLDGIITGNVVPFWKRRFNVDEGNSSNDIKIKLLDLYNRHRMRLPADLKPEIHTYYSQTHQPTHYHGGIISSVGRHIFVNAGKAYDLYPEELAAGLAHETGHCAMNSYEIGIALSNRMSDTARRGLVNEEQKKFARDIATYIEILADAHSVRVLGDSGPMIRFLARYENIAVSPEPVRLRIKALRDNSVMVEK